MGARERVRTRRLSFNARTVICTERDFGAVVRLPVRKQDNIEIDEPQCLVNASVFLLGIMV